MMDIHSLIRKKALAAGVDPTHALTMVSSESGFDPRAANKYGYKGLYALGLDSPAIVYRPHKIHKGSLTLDSG